MKQNQHILIVGAGLVGSLLAIFLRKQNYQVTLCEKRTDIRSASDGGGRSINLVVTSRGVHALNQVGILEDILKITVPVYGRMIHDPAGNLAYQPYGKDNSECNYSVSRGDLNKKLLDKVEEHGAKIHFSAPLDQIDFRNKKARFGSTEITYDFIIGADGAGSVVRTQLFKYLSQNKIMPVADSVKWLDCDYKELLMPAKGDGQSCMEKHALHIWPRGEHMMMGLPNLDGSFTMTLYLPKSYFAKLTSEQEIVDFFKKYYVDSIPLMPELLSDFFQHPQGHLGTVRCFPWTDGLSAGLIGDAAHAIVPFFGQGMNAGFEDCTYLMKFLSESQSFSEAFAEFQVWQKPNTDAIADMALENFVEMRDKVGNEQFMLRKKVDGMLEKKFPEKYRTRYAMITYTLIPYADALAAGLIQADILDELCRHVQAPEQVDMALAEKLIDQKFVPYLKQRKIYF